MVDSQRHTFQASGSLWQDALVMQDVETESLWSQISGIAIQGPLESSQLTLYPSSQTTFAEFKKLYPYGRLLKKNSPEGKGSRYADYYAAPDKLGIFGRVDDFKRLPGKTLVYGLRLKDRQVAVSLDKLEKDNLVLIDGNGRSLIVAYNPKGGTVVAYQLPASVSVRTSDFKIEEGRIGSTDGVTMWSLATGEPVAGSSGVEKLHPLPILSSYWFAWISFFPETELIR